MDIKKTISSTTVRGQKDSAGRDFKTQLNIALDEGACPAVLFFHEPRAHPSRDDSHGRGDRFLFLR